MVLHPTIPNLLTVSKGRKEAMWQLLSKIFILPRRTQDKAKHYAKKMLGESLCRWKSELNISMCRRAEHHLQTMGTSHQHNEKSLFGKKNSEESLALSKKNRDLAMSNIYKVRLNPVGYQRKVDQWQREREVAIAVGQPNPFAGLTERGWFWLEARKPKIVEGKPHFDKPETEAVARKMYELTELQKEGKFRVKRDKDVLSTAIGMKEHRGRVRGVTSKLTFREGFEEDRST